MDVHSKALDSMFNDMDDMESNKMFPEENKGVSITISVSPAGEISTEEPTEEMNKGGMACAPGEEGYSKGGVVEPEKEESEDLSLPPFLRKKKKSING